MRKQWLGTAIRASITSGISSGSLAVACTALTGWPVSGNPFIAVLDVNTPLEEWVLCDSRSGNTLNVNPAGRGYVGSPVAHNPPCTVRHAVDFVTIDEANRFVNLMTTKGDLVGFDGSLAQRIAAATTDQQVLRRLAGASAGVEWTHLGTFPVFTSTGARDAAIPSPVDGQGWYRNTGDATEGIEIYDGVAYRLPWNMPWGDQFQPVDSAATQTNLTAVTDITGTSQTWTSVLRRWLKYSFSLTVELNTASASGSTTIQITDGANTVLHEFYVLANANNITAWPHTYSFAIVRQEAGGSITRKLRCTGNGNGVNIGTFTPHVNVQFSVEDIGPVTGAPA